MQPDPDPHVPNGSLAQLVRSCRPVLMQMPVGCTIADPDFRAVLWNSACERIFGFSEAEILGKTPFETVVPGMASGAVRKVQSCIRDGQLGAYSENDNVTKDGRRLRCRWHNAPLCAADGSTIGIIAVVLDVTEQDRELQAVRRREAQARTVFEAAPDAILTLDQHGVVQTFNVEAERLFGYPAFQLSGLHIGQLLVDAGWSPERPFDAAPGARELTGARADGSRFVAGSSLAAVDLQDQKLVTVIVHDLTSKKLAERQQHERWRMESLGRLAGGVAHDFNNLLTVISGACSLLSNTPHTPQSQVLLDSILQACDRAAGLTGQLLAFSKQQTYSPQPFDLNIAVAGHLSLLARIVGERWPLATRYALDPCVVRADRGQLEQVLMNLVVNARDAMPGGGVIGIETLRAGAAGASGPAYVSLVVSDTGQGMDADTQVRIFEPFFSTKGSNKGTGLGLATVYGIVEQAGGEVFVKSEPGKGSRFEVRLPAVSDAAIALGAPEISRETSCALDRRIALLIEDDDQVRTTTAEMLRKLGMQVETAADASQALALAAKRKFDVLVTDLALPGVDGRVLAEKLRRGGKVPVLFVTGYAEDAVLGGGALPREAQLLQKPFTMPVLAQALASLLRA